MIKTLLTLLVLATTLTINLEAQTYQMPAETSLHEGTWLQWPHHHEYGNLYRNRLDPSWVSMTQSLIPGEKVHIIAYDTLEQNRITNLLTAAGISLTNIDFKVFPTNDVWIRDNGPIYVRDAVGDLHIEDWGFNGWGGKYNSDLCDPIPSSIGASTGLPVLDLNATMTIEGGAFEIDGHGLFMACKSSILSQAPANSVRNPGMTQAQAEVILAQYLGVSKFIWLEGFTGTDDITDAHIDGFAKFANDSTLVTMSPADLMYWGLSATDISKLMNASDINNQPFHITYLPLTQQNVVTTYGYNLGYKGSYCNYYIGNTVILVPNYNDANDAIANSLIQGLHPERTVIGIDMRNLYAYGGMVHCVTQQQPVIANSTGINQLEQRTLKALQNVPNPFSQTTQLTFILDQEQDVQIDVLNQFGQIAFTKAYPRLFAGDHTLTIPAESLQNGVYWYVVKLDQVGAFSGRMIVQK